MTFESRVLCIRVMIDCSCTRNCIRSVYMDGVCVKKRAGSDIAVVGRCESDP